MLAELSFADRISSNLTATPNITTPGIRLTANATPHSKGAYGVLSASVPHDVYGITLTLAGSVASATLTHMMLDLAIGAGGSEVVIFPEYLCGFRGTMITGPQTIYLPFFIPKGTRVAARIQAVLADDTLDVMCFFHTARSRLAGPLFRRADAYGTDIATSRGTAHTPGNSGSESTDANIGSTLSRSYRAVMLGINGTTGTTTMTAIAYHWELTVGGVTLGEWYTRSHTTEEVKGPYPEGPNYVNLPVGAQLQVQAEGSGTSLAHDVAFYCLY